MEKNPYYLAYEKRYQAVFAAGGERWGHAPDDKELVDTLTKWVEDNHLRGKRILEFACGEGAGGVILSSLGCSYHGVDISRTAVEKATDALRMYPNATVSRLDMVQDVVPGQYDAALDCMGFHMLVTDGDRAAYLKNAFQALKDGAPMLFYKESYRRNPAEVYKGAVRSFDDWKKIANTDYTTPSLRKTKMGSGEVEVRIPLVPARANDRDGYLKEMEQAGFTVEQFREMDISEAIQYSASIYARKPFLPSASKNKS